MIIFKSAKKSLAALGYDANKPPFNRKQSMNVMHSFLAIVLEFMYIVYNANTVREYINSIFMTTIGKYRKIQNQPFKEVQNGFYVNENITSRTHRVHCIFKYNLENNNHLRCHSTY